MKTTRSGSIAVLALGCVGLLVGLALVLGGERNGSEDVVFGAPAALREPDPQSDRERVAVIEELAPRVTDLDVAAPRLGEQRLAAAPQSGRVAVETADRETERQGPYPCSGVVEFEAGLPPDEKVSLFLNGREIELSDRDTFEFESTRREVELEVRGRYYYMAQPKGVDLAVDSFVRLIPIPGARVKGELVPPAGDRDLDGRATNASVALQVLGAEEPEPRNAVLSAGLDGNRTFDLGPVPPSASVTVNFASLRMRGYVVRGLKMRAAAAKWVTLMPPEGARVRGRVIDQAGFARPLVRVHARPERGPVREQWTGVDGSFDLRGIEPGEIVVEAAPRGFVPTSVDVGYVRAGEVRQGVLLTLTYGAALRGVAYLQGRPASIVTVVAEELNGGGLRSVRTDMQGVFELQGLADGEWFLHSEDRQYAAPGQDIERWCTTVGPYRLAGQRHEVGFFELGRTALLEIDVALWPPRNVTITLERNLAGTDIWFPPQEHRFQANEFIAIDDLEAALWRVSARSGSEQGETEVRLFPGDLRREHVRLAP